MPSPRQRRGGSKPTSGSSARRKSQSLDQDEYAWLPAAIVVVSVLLVVGGTLFLLIVNDWRMLGKSVPNGTPDGDDNTHDKRGDTNGPSSRSSFAASSSEKDAEDISMHRAPVVGSGGDEMERMYRVGGEREKTDMADSLRSGAHVGGGDGGHVEPLGAKDVVLASGHTMPWLGLGTRTLKGHEGTEIIRTAIHAGYRLFDTAAVRADFYQETLGQAIVKTGVPRINVFIINKLPVADSHHFKHYLEASLKKLQTNYVDLLLLEINKDVSVEFLEEAWRIIEGFASAGKARSVGLSNASESHLTRVVKLAKLPVSAVQNVFDPFQQDREVRSLCRKHKIAYIGRQTLGGFWMSAGMLDKNPVLTNEIIEALAVVQKASTAQLVLRWAVNEGVVVLPGSSKEDHLRENIVALQLNIAKNASSPLEHFNGLLENFVQNKPAPTPCQAKSKMRAQEEEVIDDEIVDEEEETGDGSNEEGAEEEDEHDPYATDIQMKDIEQVPESTFPSLESLKQWAEESQWGKIGTVDVILEVKTGQPILLVCVSKEEKRKGRLVALNPADGSEFWSFKVNDHLRAPPAVSDDRETLYLGTMDWHVYALDTRDAGIIWEHKNTDSFIMTPLLHNDVLYIGSMGGKMFALKASSGEMIWSSHVSQVGFSATPLYYSSKNGDVLYVPTLDMEWSNLKVIHAATGEMLHEVELSGSVSSSPIFSLDRKRLFAAGAGLVFDSALVHALRVGGKPKSIWSTNTGELDEYAPTMALSSNGEQLFVVHSSGAFFIIDANTGRKLHKQRLGHGPITSEPLIDKDGNILLISGDGTLYIIDIKHKSKRMERAKKIKTGVEVWSTPALDKEKSVLYCGTKDGFLSAFDYRNGRHLGHVDLNGTIRAPILLLEQRHRQL